ncbi:glycosyltransferase family 2 protein [Aggregatibacter actinomycetemcomitans]|uniref:Rhamnosyltrasferase n=1 Tax=Aggregatibacter actinomycetemcomitans TaxID=714 RepID=O05372_AGGAC|nr:glycosyltransferase family 2 protein [Aggregatibacter actinomycetemcomitans]AEW77975.1 rhamnosyltrasferase [Aggregatibacter actinomycetemcomitans ANH9381]BAA19639.1 rhamnosyltrasferase [Aggregatibacter actinomycetemcomitans Y4]AHN72718.1 rhamnosyltrasferase [Aggregatibacter actinomycetemcomitans HK1651]AMQ92051.1 rhamnosyl transferase [Aggregatibacter actinomycetemcomitans]KND84188.1 rhamnosyl transferase [Aggregatibacter actinomycetemcomitans serotype b str. SCC1398]
MKASIIIPLKNGGDIFKQVLSSVLLQKLDAPFEVIVIDSGSKDGSVEYLNNIIKNHDNVRLYQIKPYEFGHGKTRNYGASLSKGEFLVFITQDALPANEFWLEEMIKPFSLDENIQGVFGKHLPYEDCDIFEKNNLYTHFNNFGKGIVVYKIEDKARYDSDEGYRHLLCFYSDNSSAMRKCIWDKYPYDDVDFAEDQIWAKRIIELGYFKAYNENAIVFHSHNYSFKEMLMRSFDDHKGLYKIYGYKSVKNIFYLPIYIIKHTINDMRFLKTKKLSKKEKLYWSYFSLIKNTVKYTGAYFGPKGTNNKLITKLFSRELILRNK